MVSWVKPPSLGTVREFKRMFITPIKLGQDKDASKYAIRKMKNRAFVLNKKLRPIVDRKDITELAKDLPPKREFVVSIRMTKFQKFLYTAFLKNLEGCTKGRLIFCAYQALLRLWDHPSCIVFNSHDIENGKKGKGQALVGGRLGAVKKDLAPVYRLFQEKGEELSQQLELTASQMEREMFGEDNEDDNAADGNESGDREVISVASDDDDDGDDDDDDDDDDYVERKVREKEGDEEEEENDSEHVPSEKSDGEAAVATDTDDARPQSARSAYSDRNSIGSVVGGNDDRDDDGNKENAVPMDVADPNEAVDDDDADDSNGLSKGVADDGADDDVDADAAAVAAADAAIADEVEALKHIDEVLTVPHDWWRLHQNKEVSEKLSDFPDDNLLQIPLLDKELLWLGSKVPILLSLLAKSANEGDKVLVFSQSLLALNFIEEVLQMSGWGDMVGVQPSEALQSRGVRFSKWKLETQYMRLDGSTSDRKKLINRFNSSTNMKLFLISTKAGNMGINLQSANRVGKY